VKELMFTLAICLVFAVVVWPSDKVADETWRELHECDGKFYEIVVDRAPSKAFLTEFCRGIGQ